MQSWVTCVEGSGSPSIGATSGREGYIRDARCGWEAWTSGSPNHKDSIQFSYSNNWWNQGHYKAAEPFRLINKRPFFFQASAAWSSPLALSHFPLFILIAYIFQFPLQASQQLEAGESLIHHWPGWLDVSTGTGPWQFKPVVLVSSALVYNLKIVGEDNLPRNLSESWAPRRHLGSSCWMLKSRAWQGSWGRRGLPCASFSSVNTIWGDGKQSKPVIYKKHKLAYKLTRFDLQSLAF